METSTQAVNYFAADLSNKLISDDHTGNLVTSPIGLVTILSMILAGSKSQTFQQLANVLNVKEKNIEQLHQSFQHVLSTLDRKPGQAEEFVKNLGDEISAYSGYDLYTKSIGFTSESIIEEYMSFLKQYYKAEMEPTKGMDMKNLMSKVNNWINNSTFGRIKEIIDSPPDPKTKLVLVNSVFFSGQWAKPFKQVTPGTFYNNGVHAKTVDMMSKEEFFNVGVDTVNGENIQIFELPYVGSASMVIIMPESKSGINKILKSDMQRLIERFESNKQETTAKVTMPKFKVDSSLNLLEAIAEMGASDLVDFAKADLSNMTGKNIGLYLNALKHKTQIDINENGTIAAASTMAGFATRALIIAELEFVVDRPFAFVIHDHVSKTILFIGKIAEL